MISIFRHRTCNRGILTCLLLAAYLGAEMLWDFGKSMQVGVSTLRGALVFQEGSRQASDTPLNHSSLWLISGW